MKSLGSRHVEYQVKFEYYDVFGEALMEVLSSELGQDFSGYTFKSWQKFFQDFKFLVA